MQKPKYIFSVVTLSLFGIIGGYLYLSQESTQFSLSSRSNESDLVSRLRTFSGADSKWGQSPFSSGTPVVSESKEDSSPNIPQPNTLWETKTRQINGKTVTYVFGEGNPKEVAIPKEKIEEYMATVDPEMGAPYGYVTPETEQALKAFLESPSLPYVLQKCYQQIDWYHRRAQADWEKFPHDLSLENMLVIDPRTGRKELNQVIFSVIHPIIDVVINPLIPPDNTQDNPFRQCLSSSEYHHVLKLSAFLTTVTRQYIKGE